MARRITALALLALIVVVVLLQVVDVDASSSGGRRKHKPRRPPPKKGGSSSSGGRKGGSSSSGGRKGGSSSSGGGKGGSSSSGGRHRPPRPPRGKVPTCEEQAKCFSVSYGWCNPCGYDQTEVREVCIHLTGQSRCPLWNRHRWGYNNFAHACPAAGPPSKMEHWPGSRPTKICKMAVVGHPVTFAFSGGHCNGGRYGHRARSYDIPTVDHWQSWKRTGSHSRLFCSPGNFCGDYKGEECGWTVPVPPCKHWKA